MRRAVFEVLGWNPEAAVGFSVVARKFKSKVTLSAGETAIDGKDQIEVLALRPAKGAEVTLEVTGEDEQQAFDVLLADLFAVTEEAESAEERVRREILESEPTAAETPEYLTDEDFAELMRKTLADTLETETADAAVYLGGFRGSTAGSSGVVRVGDLEVVIKREVPGEKQGAFREFAEELLRALQTADPDPGDRVKEVATKWLGKGYSGEMLYRVGAAVIDAFRATRPATRPE